MKRVLVLVEGQTEETFVRDILEPHLEFLEIFLTPTLVSTKRVKTGGTFKGGVVSYGKVRNDLQRLLGDSDAAAITTMFDYYGLPADFPGMSTRPSGPCFDRVRHVESAIAHDIGDPRFLPYLQLHEFEALLFSDPREVAARFPETDCLRALNRARQEFDSPEEINERFDLAPSRRIAGVVSAYRKPLHGPQIAEAIGLDRIRAECRHFGEWVARLESL